MEDSTVSEGIGYWMLLSVLANDKTTFDGLWSYAKTYLNQNGLMSWQIMPDGKVPETDSASDGDQDIAWALYLAERTWGGYESDMKSMINAVMAYDIDPEKLVLKGGDAWSLTDGVSLAYTRPGYYPVFAGITGDDRWNQVLFNSLNLVDNLMTVSPAGTTGLVPDFMDIDSLPSEARGEESYVYSWVATRYPLFYAQALGLCGSSSGNRISGYLSLINGFFKSQRGNLVAGYTLDGRPLVDYQELTFISGTLTASAVSDDAAYRQQVLQTVINHPVDQYFGDSLRLLALAIFANRMGPTVLDYP
ncbi:hypothetical protein A2Z33_04410 [Candidatus Gottesmanbacteria bacterium RBG_16_52_11]|uniref:Glucanase n=1 Tax=Candidatus Gottesmanbacteria bacterium RBG_16_52_11 TaxID=1798374 RepID=A0A1F5YW88_9BACT|nr:MAG: hypothetical protein A2Z33_04410 [Candidatus Gottesmanbacteria bacterium RBG_16_52_11]